MSSQENQEDIAVSNMNLNRFVQLCAVGMVAWMGIIQGAVKLLEVMS